MSARRAVRWIIHLRRRTTTGRWLPEIDGLRFIAILSVLLFHLQGQFDHHYSLAVQSSFFAVAVRAFGFGNRGVPLFFVISGFILALPFARQHLFSAQAPPLRRYYLRRVTRLEPPYLLNLLLVALGAALLDHHAWHELLPHLAASMVYLHYAFFRSGSTINSVAWSLEVEAQFYVLAPALATVFALRRPALRRAALAAAMLLAALLQVELKLSQFTLAGDVQYFLAGLLLAEFYLTSASPSPSPAKRTFSRIGWDLISLAGWPAFLLLGNRLAAVWLPFLALLLCLAAMRGELTPRLLRKPAIAVTGGMCYTIYLWHAPVFTFIDRALRAHAALLPRNCAALYVEEAVVKFAAVAFVCLPLFILIERPCMDPQWLPKLVALLRRPRESASVLVPDRVSKVEPFASIQRTSQFR